MNTREREITEKFFRIDLTNSSPRYQTLNLISISLLQNYRRVGMKTGMDLRGQF